MKSRTPSSGTRGPKSGSKKKKGDPQEISKGTIVLVSDQGTLVSNASANGTAVQEVFTPQLRRALEGPQRRGE